MFSKIKTPVWFAICCCLLVLQSGCGPSAETIRATTQAEFAGTATVAAIAQSTSAAQQAQDARATAAVEVQATVTVLAQATATAGAQATANAAAQATAVAQAQATAVAQVQAAATAAAQAAATAQVQATSKAQTLATSTAQAAATKQAQVAATSARATPLPTATPVPQPATVNDVWNLRVQDISPNELQVTVDYGYTGDHGEEAYIGVEATGEIPGRYTPWGFAKIRKGRGTVTVRVLCYYPGYYICKSGKTDALWVKLLTGTRWELNFFQKMFKYNKQWAPG